MSISVMAMGRMKEKPYRQMADEYLKRLSRYGKFEEIELPDLPEPANTSEAIERQIRDKEGEMMLSRLKPSDYVIALTIPGKMHDSPCLSRHLDELLTRGEKVGVLKVRLFRPFSAKHLLSALPESARSVAVLDRTKEPGAHAEPLYLDVMTALAEAFSNGERETLPRVIGGRYGLSSKEFGPD